MTIFDPKVQNSVILDAACPSTLHTNRVVQTSDVQQQHTLTKKAFLQGNNW